MDWTSEIVAPSDADIDASYAGITATLANETNERAWRDAFATWDGTRRTWRSWANLTRLRYTQDTRRDDYRDAQTQLDRRAPAVTALDTAMKQRFLASTARPALESELGTQAFALWDADVTTFQPAIADDLVRESELTREYTELLATASVPFAGEERSLGGLGIFLQDPDRATRHAAERARWQAFEDRAERLDELFDALVKLRDGMARKLGSDPIRSSAIAGCGASITVRTTSHATATRSRAWSCRSRTISCVAAVRKRASIACASGTRPRSAWKSGSRRSATARGSWRARARHSPRSIPRSASSPTCSWSASYSTSTTGPAKRSARTARVSRRDGCPSCSRTSTAAAATCARSCTNSATPSRIGAAATRPRSTT